MNGGILLVRTNGFLSLQIPTPDRDPSSLRML